MNKFLNKKKMIETNLGKIIEQLISMFCMLKKKKYNLLMFQIVQITSNDSNCRMMALSCSKKTISIIKRNNV